MSSNYRVLGDVMPDIGHVLKLTPMQSFILREPGTRRVTMSRFCQVTTPSWWPVPSAGPAQGPINGLLLRVTPGDARQAFSQQSPSCHALICVRFQPGRPRILGSTSKEHPIISPNKCGRWCNNTIDTTLLRIKAFDCHAGVLVTCYSTGGPERSLCFYVIVVTILILMVMSSGLPFRCRRRLRERLPTSWTSPPGRRWEASSNSYTRERQRVR